MKILILINYDVGLYNFRFEFLQALIDKGYQVHVCVPNGPRVKDLISIGCVFHDVDINRHGKNPIEDIKLLKRYKFLIKEIKPMSILAYTIKPNIYGAIASKSSNVPCIANVTGLGTALMKDRFGSSVLLKMYKYALKYCQIVIFQNEDNLDYFVSNKIIEREKTILVPGSGVNITKFKPQDNSRTDDNIKFLFIGRLMKDKGIDEYLEASEAITNKYSNVEFYLLGSFEESKYENIIKNNKNNRIKHLGFSSDVRREIREVDCIVNPSYHEGMSNVLLEGAAMGKPLLASNIPGCKEIIDDKKNGFLFEPRSADDLEEKIIKFINLTDDERKRMGESSRKKVVEEFDRQIVINEYMKVIESIK